MNKEEYLIVIVKMKDQYSIIVNSMVFGAKAFLGL